jgi:hypothetical protein
MHGEEEAGRKVVDPVTPGHVHLRGSGTYVSDPRAFVRTSVRIAGKNGRADVTN